MTTDTVKQIAIALHTETKQGDHLKPLPWKASGNFTQADADACNAAEAAREQAREAGNIAIRQKREADTPEVYESSDVPGKFGFVGCDSDQYETREAAEQARDQAIINTIDTEAPPTCWTEAQSAAWNRELDRDKARPWVREGESFRQWITRLNLADNHDNWEKWADESHAEREKRLAAYCSPYPKPRNKAWMPLITQ